MQCVYGGGVQGADDKSRGCHLRGFSPNEPGGGYDAEKSEEREKSNMAKCMASTAAHIYTWRPELDLYLKYYTT